MEQQEKQDKIMRKLRKQLKFYMKKVEDIEGTIWQFTVFKGYIFYMTSAHN